MRLATIPGFLLAGFVVGAIALDFTGAAAPTLLNDAGPLGRFGLPIAEFLFDAAMAVTIGALVLATLVFPRSPARRIRNRDRKKAAEVPVELDPAWTGSLLVAEVASVVWTISAVAVLVLTFVDTAGAQAFQGDFTAQLGVYVTQVPYGQMWTLIVLLAAAVSTLVFALRSHTGIALTTVLSALPLIPQALMGHAAEASGHLQAVNSIGLHLVAVVLWLGGLVAMALLAPVLTPRDDLPVLVSRFSALALFSWVLMVYSGLVNASLRVGSLDDWMSPYGLVIVGKILITVVLGVIGYWHRSFVIGRLQSGAPSSRTELWRLLGVETLLFGAVMSLGVVLSRSQPPVPDEPSASPTPAEILTREPLPPPPSWANFFLEWQIDPLWVVVTVGLSVAYIAGFVRVRRRGDSWPVHRLILWLVGMAGLFYVTSGGAAVYGRVLFSAHMIQHMLLVMAVPLPMVLGAPITLLMRAVRPRTDGSRGFREWILGAVHSPYLRFWAHPVVAAINFAGSLVVFYYTGVMWYALETHLGHELMIAHFLAAGYLFAQSMIGIDPGVNRFNYPVRLLVLLVTMAFHAFFGVSVMSSTSLIEGDWYGNIGHGWIPAIDDQVRGGEIAWGIGEFPTLILAIIVATQWARSSDREAKRRDRAEDRSGDAELSAYNEMLSKLNER
nr:cytochrome c oxidase assembly protein [Brevibacterium daeguense]